MGLPSGGEGGGGVSGTSSVDEAVLREKVGARRGVDPGRQRPPEGQEAPGAYSRAARPRPLPHGASPQRLGQGAVLQVP